MPDTVAITSSLIDSINRNIQGQHITFVINCYVRMLQVSMATDRWLFFFYIYVLSQVPYISLRQFEWRRFTKTANLCRSTAASYPKSLFRITGYRPEGRDTSVDRAIRQVRGSNPGGGEIFRTRPKRPWTSCTVGTGSLSRGEAVGAWR